VTGYRAAVVGCGRIGAAMEADAKRIKPATHAGAYARGPGARLVALVDPAPERLATAGALFPDAARHPDVDALLAAGVPDIVSVCSPAASHRAIVEQLAAGGVKAIVCEKPIAETPDDGRAMVAACHDAGCLLYVNHMRRFDPQIADARDRVRGGAIGEVLQACAWYVGGVQENGTHIVDLLRYVLGEVEWVSAVPEERFPRLEGDANVNALLGFEGGVCATMQALDVTAYNIFDVRFFGRTGSLLLDRLSLHVVETPLRECVDYAGFMELDVEHAVRRGSSRSFFAPMLAHVIDCLEGRARVRSSGEDGLAALETVWALRRSAEAGGARVTPGMRTKEVRR
jgi:predicted dehydrogenase